MKLLITAVLAFATMGAPALVSPASAEVQYPWCAQYRPPLDAVNCGFTSYPQCMATISGIGGYCYRNPAYPPPPSGRTRGSRSN